MFKRIDRSPTLARLLERLSATLARQRGLPIVLGVILVVLLFVFPGGLAGAAQAFARRMWSVRRA